MTSDGRHGRPALRGLAGPGPPVRHSRPRPDGDPRPDVLDAIEHTVAAAIWFGITTGCLTLTGSYDIPGKLAECV